MKRMGFGFFEKDLEYYYPTKNKAQRILTSFEGLLITTGVIVLGFGVIKFDSKTIASSQINFKDTDFEFAAIDKQSIEYWAYRMCDIQRVGIINPKDKQ